MESILWLLPILLIVGILAAIKPLSRRYAVFRVKVSTRIKEIRQQLYHRWEDLWIYNKVYLESYSDQDAGRYGQRAQAFQQSFMQARDALLASLRERTRIQRSLPRWEKPSLKYRLAGIGRFFKWQRADREVERLGADIQGQENQIEEVKRSLKSLKDLPLEAASLAKDTRDLCRETAGLLDALSGGDRLGGNTMEDSIQFVKNTEKDLGNIPSFFFNLTPEELVSQTGVKSETLNVLLILEPAWESLNDLNKQAKDWKAKVEDLRKKAASLETRVMETETIYDRLNKSLILSGEQEELSALCQKADQVQENITVLSVENLAPTLNDSNRTLDGLMLLTQTLSAYEERLKKLQGLSASINEEMQAVDNKMTAAAARQEYPLTWTNSQKAFEGVREKLASIPGLSERRTPAELVEHVKIAEDCNVSLANLQTEIDRVAADLDGLCALWMQIRPVYSSEWLAGVEQLYAGVKIYDMQSNWAEADRADALYSDAESLLKTANGNIPSSTSIPIYEQEVGPRLMTAQDLQEKKPLFDERKARIETRLRQMQEQEKEALSIHKRIAPAVHLFAKRIRSINIPTKHAQDMLAADATRVALEKSLNQRSIGNVSKKLEDVRKWERSSAENGAMVYRWVEDDLLKRKVAINGNLKEIETFAEDLEDDIVERAHKYDLVFAPHYSDVELHKKQSLDAVQEEAVILFNEWQDVKDCQWELAKFIAPVREEYEKMQAALRSLDGNCSQLEASLDRDWKPVFQTARYLRTKIDNLEKDIDGIRKLRWKRSDLERNYYFLWQRLRDLDMEAQNLRRLDEQDVEEVQALEKEYRNIVREYARRVYAENDAGIRKEVSSGEAFLKTLAEQYRNGRKTGTNDPSALEVKARLQRKIESYKQQIVDYNIARMDDVMLEREKGRLFMPTGQDIPVPSNRTDYITTLFRLITDLQKVYDRHPDIEFAIEELRFAHTEARKSRPASRELRRFMTSAKGTLVEVEKSVPETAPVVHTITVLTGIIPVIFG